jgi:hypothetical protein
MSLETELKFRVAKRKLQSLTKARRCRRPRWKSCEPPSHLDLLRHA